MSGSSSASQEREYSDPAPLGSPVAPSHKRPAALDRFWFGTVYYPEHWDEATRRKDAPRMREAGVSVVRMAEFAWDLLEPEEGRYDFALFDATIAELSQHGISSILCTPTATPPRWLTIKHPEVVRVNASGVPLTHGSRQHACHMNLTFRHYSRSITSKLAEHFRGAAGVVGWQTDNEFYCHFSECHCQACQRAFWRFLRHKFKGDIGLLNRTWGTQFWSQTYAAFEDVPTPRDQQPTYLNPAHQLDYFRHLSDGVWRFQHEQVAILRQANAKWFVFHNSIGGHIDYRGSFTRDLDVLGYDVYPMFCWEHAARPADQAFAIDAMRALSGNMIVPEHQAGAGGQPTYFHDAPEPGELRLLTYTSIAHGADSLLYFRWRTCRFGAEQYWCGILDHDDVPRRRYAEVKTIGAELLRLGPELLGTHVHVEAAVASGDFDVNGSHATYALGLPAPREIAGKVHAALFARGLAAGCVHPADDLSELKLYVIPHFALFDPAWLPNLTAFVERGGVLVVGARSGTRDLNNNIVDSTPPGCLAPLCGVTVEEYGRQNRPEARPLALALGDVSVKSELWYEELACHDGAQPLATWRGRHLEGKPAISERRVGKGTVLYVGSYLTPALLEALVPLLIERARLTPLWPDLPAGVNAVRRQSADQQLWFFLNSTTDPQSIPTSPPGVNLLDGQPSNGPVLLPAYGVAVIQTKL